MIGALEELKKKPSEGALSRGFPRGVEYDFRRKAWDLGLTTGVPIPAVVTKPGFPPAGEGVFGCWSFWAFP